MTTRRVASITLLLLMHGLVILPAPLGAQRKTQERIDEYVRPFAESNNFSGVVLVARDGDVVFRRGYGMADVDRSIPTASTDRFQIGSISKSFTAAAILLLQEAGTLAVEEKIDRFLPDLPRADRITVRDLLVHESGLPRLVFFPDYRSRMRSAGELRDLVDWIVEISPITEPKRRKGYSNANYILLARIVEIVSGQPYGEFLRGAILDPLRLSNTGYRSERADSMGGFVRGHVTVGIDALEPTEYGGSQIATGAGALYSTVDDLFALFSGLRDERLLGSEALKEMFAPQQGQRGYGWLVGRELGREAISLNGWDGEGFSSSFIHFPEEDLTIVVLCNLNISGVTNEITNGIAAIELGEPYQPLRLHPVTLAPDLAPQMIGRYRFGPDFYVPNGEMKVVAKDGALFEEQPQTGRLQALLPTESGEFIHRSHFFRVGFERGDDGTIVAMRYDRFVAERVEEPKP